MKVLSTDHLSENLDQIATDIAAARDAASVACSLVKVRPDQAADQARTAKAAAVNALERLGALGVQIPAFGGVRPAASSNIAFDQLDTAASRELLAALGRIWDLAMAVDKERGNVDSQGRSVGYAEDLECLTIKLRTEVLGPPERD